MSPEVINIIFAAAGGLITWLVNRKKPVPVEPPRPPVVPTVPVDDDPDWLDLLKGVRDVFLARRALKQQDRSRALAAEMVEELQK